jgi:hypothetical protein
MKTCISLFDDSCSDQEGVVSAVGGAWMNDCPPNTAKVLASNKRMTPALELNRFFRSKLFMCDDF